MKKFSLSFVFILLFSVVSFSEIIGENFPVNTEMFSRNDPATIINKYIQAVGGLDKLKSIKNASLTGEANFQGQIIEIKTVSDAENTRLMQSTSVGGNVIQKTLFSEGKGQMEVMGQVQELPAEMSPMLKAQTYVFPEIHYETLGYKLAFMGKEDLDGEQVNKLEITAPNGMVTNEFYSVTSGLKVKMSNVVSGDVMYSDYQEVDGVKFPMTMTIKNPMLPVALETKIKSLNFNQVLSSSDFQ